MTPNRPLNLAEGGSCEHINWHSMLNGRWALCDDCGQQHVRAVMENDGESVRITACQRSIRRALLEAAEVPVAAKGVGVLHIACDAKGVITAREGNRPVIVLGL